jgi:hypothetical protein
VLRRFFEELAFLACWVVKGAASLMRYFQA